MAAGDSRLDYWQKRYRRIKRERERTAPTDPIETLTDTEAAYIAGIVDGEGSITIAANNAHKCYQPGVQIAMCAEPLIQWLGTRLRVKCGVCKMRAPNRRAQYHVRILGRRAAWLCIAMLPWLKVKRAQAELVIAFSKTYGTGWDAAGISPEINKARTELKRKMHLLNSPDGYKGRTSFVYIAEKPRPLP